MKRFTRLALGGAIVLTMVSLVAAQSVPTPVVRMGDWVEIGNDAWMNIIASSDIRYRTSHNFDFESDVQDRMASRNPSGSSTSYVGEGDFLEAELRLGSDFRYGKNLKMRILLEAQSIYDGNLIDDRQNNTSPGVRDPLPGGLTGSAGFAGASGEDSSPHIERFWIDYSFPGTPIRMRVGADLWYTDPAGFLGDDDPRFAIFIKPMPELELQFAAVIQNESARLGLTNDNDNMYYTFGASYKTGAHQFGLHGAYFRWRFDPAIDADTVLVMLSWKGTLGPVSVLLQPMGVFGSADGTGGQSYDVRAFGVIALAEANLGMVRPFIGLILGTGDDNATDTDLNGFNNLPQNEVSLMGGTFDFMGASPTMNPWGPAAPARATLGGGNLFRHTTGNPFGDRLGNGACPGTGSAYCNAGTMVIPVGLKIFPVKGHQLNLFYIYVGLTEDAGLVALNAAGVAAGTQLALRNGGVSKALYHEIGTEYTWTLSRHFDIRLAGSVLVPGKGAKDIASTVDCDPGAAVRPCEGKDVALFGEARFRGRF